LPPLRSTGSCPALRKNSALARPLTPVPVKYSALARNVTRRLSMIGRKIESENDRWFEARIAPPVVGTFSPPRTHGRNTERSTGPSTDFRTQ
jgi:hypothetical protein